MKNASNIYFVDSNILIYLADKSDEQKYKKAIVWLESIGAKSIFISAQSIREFAYNCVKKSILPQDTLIEFIDNFCAQFIVVQDDFADTKKAVELSQGNANLFWDAAIVSVMNRKGITSIFTEDTKGFESLGVKAINPLK